MMKAIVVAALAVTLCAMAAAQPVASLADRVTAAKEMAAQGKGAEAVAALHVLLAEADKTGMDKLSAQDQVAVGDAYSVLMALAYDAAIRSGKLSKEDEMAARQWRLAILGLRNVKVIGQGKEVDLAKELVPGKINVVDFFSDYCGPCVEFAPVLEALADMRDADMFLIRVDINRPEATTIDWASPTARQFGITTVPHLMIYGADGKLQYQGDAARTKVLDMLQESGMY